MAFLSRLNLSPAGATNTAASRFESGLGAESSVSSQTSLSNSSPWAQGSGMIAGAYLYMAAIAAAELTVLIDPLLGVGLHVLILAALILHASLIPDRPFHKLLVALSLAPLVRVLSLTFPLQDVKLIYWYAIIAAPLLVAIGFIASTIGLKRRDLSLTIRLPHVQILVAATGLAFGAIEYLILDPVPLIDELTWTSFLVPAVILLVGTGFVEELAFRGVLQSAAVPALGRWAVLYVATLFAVLHVGYRSPLDVAFVFCIGLFYGWVVAKTRSLLGVTLSHGLANISLFLWIPFMGVGPLIGMS